MFRVKCAALSIMLVFYLAYFSKMLLQRKQGIQTNQMGKGTKPKKVLLIERLMKVAAYAIVPVEIISIAGGYQLWNGTFCWIGLAVASLGVAVFIMAMITMRDSWRAGIPEADKTELVTGGIYRFSRNPAFLGFDLMYIGLLLAYFNLGHFLFAAYAVIMLHLQILQEEAFLTEVFGRKYLDYKRHTGRYFSI